MWEDMRVAYWVPDRIQLRNLSLSYMKALSNDSTLTCLIPELHPERISQLSPLERYQLLNSTLPYSPTTSGSDSRTIGRKEEGRFPVGVAQDCEAVQMVPGVICRFCCTSFAFASVWQADFVAIASTIYISYLCYTSNYAYTLYSIE
jgi:hypothetical protein